MILHEEVEKNTMSNIGGMKRRKRKNKVGINIKKGISISLVSFLLQSSTFQYISVPKLMMMLMVTPKFFACPH